MSAFRVGAIRSEMRFGIEDFKRGMREVATGSSQIKELMAGASAQTLATSAALGGMALNFKALASAATAAISSIIAQQVVLRSSTVRVARDLDAMNAAFNARRATAFVSESAILAPARATDNEARAVAGLTTRYTALTATVAKTALGIGAAAVAAGLLANRLMATVRASMAFEDSFAFVRKTVNATVTELAAMSIELQDLALQVPITVHELNQIAGSAGQLGVATDHIVNFTRIMAEMGVASDLTAEQAAVGFAQWGNITGLATEEMDGLTNAVVLLGNSTATTEANILNMGVRLAGAGRVIGMTDSDIVGLAASMASLRIEAEAGGTAMSKIMLDIQAAVDRGGRELELFSSIAGRSAGQFAEQFRDAPVKALTEFIGGLSRVEASGQSVTAVLDMLGLSEVRTRDALLRLSGGADILANNIRRAGDEFRDGTARSEEAARAFDRTSAKVQILSNSTEQLSRNIGDDLKPAYESLIDTLTSVVHWMDRVIEKKGAVKALIMATPMGGAASVAAFDAFAGAAEDFGSNSRSYALTNQPMDEESFRFMENLFTSPQQEAAESLLRFLDNASEGMQDTTTNAVDLERAIAEMDPRFRRIAELNPVRVFREELQEVSKLVEELPNAMDESMRVDAFQDMWRRAREGFDSVAEAAKLVPEEYRSEFMAATHIVELEMEKKVGRRAGRKLGDEAGRAYARAMEEALKFRIELFPEEALAQEARRIQRMAEQFPETLGNEAVTRAFQRMMEDFEGRGVDAIGVLESGLLHLPERFENSMREAAARSAVAANEALMEVGERRKDDGDIGQIARGHSLADSLTGPDLVSRMTEDIEALLAAGRMDTETGNLLSRGYWDELAGVSAVAFDAIVDHVAQLAPSMVPELDRIREALRFDTALQSFDDLGRTALETGNKLRQMGANGIANVIQRMGQAVSIGVNMASTITQLPDLYEKFALAGQSAAVKVGISMRIALNWIALIADAIALVISLFGDWGDEGQKELKGMAKVVDELKDAMDNFIDAITDHLLEFVKTGELAFRDLVEYITDEIFRITVSNLVVSPLLDLGVGLLGFKDGGAFDKGHIVDSPEIFGTKSGPAIRGEAGTEVVMPAIRLADGTLGVKSAGGGGGTPVVNIYDQREMGAPPVEVSHRTGPDGEMFVDIILRKVEAGILQGDFDNALSQTKNRWR